MSLYRESYIKKISDGLGILAHTIKARNVISLYDINVLAEDFFTKILNLVYGYSLDNLNITDKNMAAIDLGDVKQKVAIQVTSDNTSAKIKYTIDKFIEKKLYQTYNTLIIIILIDKKSYSTAFDTNNLFTFDKSKDIQDYKDLVKFINSLPTEDLKKISDFIDIELPIFLRGSNKSRPNEVETIIALIEFISKNKSLNKKPNTNIVDPDYKIYKRFNEYSDFLKSLYIKMVSIYGDSIQIANSVLRIDDAGDSTICLYLENISDSFLNKTNNNPQEALDLLTIHFQEQISTSGKSYDSMAIKFYLINELIKCNIFPNKV